MNFEQIGKNIFLKTTSFSLLKFKFIQIFLMGQNVFQKMAEFLKKSTDNSVKPVDNSVKLTNFWVFKIFLFLLWLNLGSTNFFRFLLNFTEFFKNLRIHRLLNFK
jgi:hypothetical protein